MASSEDDIEPIQESVSKMKIKNYLKSSPDVSYPNTKEDLETNNDLQSENGNHTKNRNQNKEKSHPTENWRNSEAQKSASSRRQRDDEVESAKNWRDQGNRGSFSKNKPIRKEKSSHVLSWRDPEYRQLNLHLPRTNDFRHYGSTPTKVRQSTVEDGNDSALVSDDKTLTKSNIEGYFKIMCDTEIVSVDGSTELDHVWKAVNEINHENPGLFIKPPSKFFSKNLNKAEIRCYTIDSKDNLHIAKVAKILRKKIFFYPFTVTYFVGNNNLFMCCYDGDLYYYEKYKSWKLFQI